VLRPKYGGMSRSEVSSRRLMGRDIEPYPGHQLGGLEIVLSSSGVPTGCGKIVTPKIFLQFSQQSLGISKQTFTDIFSHSVYT